MTKDKNIFVLSKEVYIQDNPDIYLNDLLNNENVIDFSQDLAFISGIEYDLAKSLFGKSICDSYFTKTVLADILIDRYNAVGIDYDAIVESIYIDSDFKNKEDIENWIIYQEGIIEEIKNIQLSLEL